MLRGTDLEQREPHIQRAQFRHPPHSVRGLDHNASRPGPVNRERLGHLGGGSGRVRRVPWEPQLDIAPPHPEVMHLDERRCSARRAFAQTEDLLEVEPAVGALHHANGRRFEFGVTEDDAPREEVRERVADHDAVHRGERLAHGIPDHDIVELQRTEEGSAHS